MAVTATAWGVAAIQAPDGTITACVDQQGRPRLLDSASVHPGDRTCTRKEKQVKWNVTGPAGAPGPPGPPGAPGAPGQPGASGSSVVARGTGTRFEWNLPQDNNKTYNLANGAFTQQAGETDYIAGNYMKVSSENVSCGIGYPIVFIQQGDDEAVRANVAGGIGAPDQEITTPTWNPFLAEVTTATQRSLRIGVQGFQGCTGKVIVENAKVVIAGIR
ncbi:hypothetical protein [Conexibacter sp. SYSU D00693]|uniref:hypothetical protein n=1 Tax=Conexibacter sp. SYSU D00693 TaxID=2812560 RepID=UPI00196AE10A|nr:hypothetical protein [Conexibacter sp. SYSU D00693]